MAWLKHTEMAFHKPTYEADVTKEVVQDAGIVRGNQYTIEKWVNGSRTHFRRRGWDVYANSQTVRKGYRMCTYKYTFR